jgi:hypothetical protein
MIKCTGCKTNKESHEMYTDCTCIKCFDRQKKLRSTDKVKRYKKQYYKLNKEKLSKWGSSYRRSIKGRFTKAKKTAERDGVEFTLTFEEYSEKISKLCFYCKGYFPKVEAGTGLDKINPKCGYVYDNVHSCCNTCNRIKNDFLSLEETCAAVDAIIKVRKNNNV